MLVLHHKSSEEVSMKGLREPGEWPSVGDLSGLVSKSFLMRNPYGRL